jgi:hypothetical protein
MIMLASKLHRLGAAHSALEAGDPGSPLDAPDCGVTGRQAWPVQHERIHMAVEVMYH